MIVYFSSTGNCEFAAKQLARALADTALPIQAARTIHLAAGEGLGFVFPTYFWRLPSVVTDYLKALTVTAEDDLPYVYFIATYGSTCGQTGTFMKRLLRKKGLPLSLCCSVKTVDDWTVWFDLTKQETVSAALATEAAELSKALDLVTRRETGSYMRDTLPMPAVMGSGIFYNMARKTKHLRVKDSCIGCGKCAAECPTRAIALQDGRPAWTVPSCAMCLHCLHTCPVFAIQYEDKTEAHGQYRHP